MRPALAVVTVFALGATTATAAPAIKPAGAIPAEIAAAVKEVLVPEGQAVVSGETSLAEFWLRRDMTRREGAAKLGAEYAIAEGSLVGATRFPGGFKDYMGNAVPKGVYTLRYAVQPADGNHMGVSIFRDFLLLVPAADDADPKPVAYADLVAASRKATGTKHPAVLSLVPVPKEAALPAIVRNDLDQPALAVEAGGIRLGLVFEGQGEH